MSARVLVACVGNIFLGDDAFGVEVARRLAERRLPDGVRVVDFGIRGLDLAYAFLDGYETVILVDAAPRGGAPGTLYVVEPERPAAPGAGPLQTHNVTPTEVLRMAAALGAEVGRLLLVGCEPAALGEADEMQEGLSEAVRKAVDEAVVLIEDLVGRLLAVPATGGEPCRD